MGDNLYQLVTTDDSPDVLSVFKNGIEVNTINISATTLGNKKFSVFAFYFDALSDSFKAVIGSGRNDTTFGIISYNGNENTISYVSGYDCNSLQAAFGIFENKIIVAWENEIRIHSQDGSYETKPIAKAYFIGTDEYPYIITKDGFKYSLTDFSEIENGVTVPKLANWSMIKNTVIDLNNHKAYSGIAANTFLGFYWYLYFSAKLDDGYKLDDWWNVWDNREYITLNGFSNGYTFEMSGNIFSGVIIPEEGTLLIIGDGSENNYINDADEVSLKYAKLYVNTIRTPLRKYNSETSQWERLDNFFGEE